jgi:hypothetical protein
MQTAAIVELIEDKLEKIRREVVVAYPSSCLDLKKVKLFV